MKDHTEILVEGRLAMSPKGFGFVVPDVRESEADTDVYVTGAHLETAMHNDRVLVRVTVSGQEGRAREGEILRVLERANRHIVGTFEAGRKFGFVTPDDAKISQDIFIRKKDALEAKTGSKVVAEVTKWPSKHHNAEGRIIEVLGQSGEPGVDILSIMRKYELSERFPEDVQAAADRTEQSPAPEEYSGRRDRRDLRIVTIDGEDSKDLDDGVYAEKRPDGGYFLGVYIADVSHYVRENQPLDREARERGTSVYLVDRVIPMLPKELSNGICSLNAGEDRLAMACEMQLGRDGRIESYEILPTVIRVYRRLTYHIVNRVLVDREEMLREDQADILPMLEHLAQIRHLRKKLRQERGAIDFEIPELKVKLDAEGHPVAMVKRTGSLAESIIEECMLAANETVAEHMDRKHLPFVYRVHEQPSDEKIERLNQLLGTFSLFVHKDSEGQIHPMDVQRVLRKVEGKPEERVISMVSLRSMQQARYATDSLGHFGLAARYYTHFTSPIRRYPDLIVHRLLRETFATGTISAVRQEQLRGILPEIAEHASQRERVAIEAERETTDLKKIEYMAQFVGEEFDGVISGVTAFGIFVELENGVEGLVHVTTMANDYYAYVEAQYALIGERTGQAYRLGDEVSVVLVRANLEERNLDFVLKDNNADSGRLSEALPQKQGHESTRRKPVKGKKHTGQKSREDKKKAISQNKKTLSADQLIAHIVPDAAEPLAKHRKRRSAKGRKLAGDFSSVVWPDPPKRRGKHRDDKDAEAKRKRHKSRKRPHLHRKTEAGTKDNK